MSLCSLVYMEPIHPPPSSSGPCTRPGLYQPQALGAWLVEDGQDVPRQEARSGVLVGSPTMEASLPSESGV
jgi:hypothetical protein